MKQKLSLFLILAMIFFLTSAAAGSGISVTVNNSQLSFDVPPMIEDGRTLVPLRAKIGRAHV